MPSVRSIFSRGTLGRFGGATMLLAGALLIGRASGIVREFLLAAKLGTSAQADYAVVLLTLPDLFVNLLIAGGLSAVLVPQFRQCNDDQRRQLFWRVSLIAFAVFGIIAGISIIAPEIIFGLLVPGLRAPVDRIGLLAIALAASAIPLSALSGVSGSYLNAEDRYFMVGLGTLMFNMAIIAALLFATNGSPMLVSIGVGVFAGASVRWISQMLVLPGEAWHFRGLRRDAIAIQWGAFFAAVLATASTLLAPVVIRAAASATGVGAVASLNYAQKLVELPTAVLFSAISTVALTRMSRAHVEKGRDAARQQLSNGLQRVLLLALPATVGSVFFAVPIVQITYGYGAMSASGLRTVAALFGIGALALPAAGFNLLFMAYLNATGRSVLVFRATLTSLLALLIFLLPGISQESLDLLVWASVMSQMFLAVLFLLVVRRSDQLRWLDLSTIIVSREWVRRLILAIAIMLLGVALDAFLGVSEPFARLAIMAAAFALAFLASSGSRDAS